MPDGDASRARATVSVLAAAALFGTTGAVLVNAPETADAYSVGSVRLLLGAATLLAVASLHRPAAHVSAWRMHSTAVGAVGVAVFQLCYFLAVDRTGVAIATVATIGSGPVVSGLLSTAIHRRPPTQRWLFGTAVSVAGIVLIGVAGRATPVDAVGVLLAVCAGTGWAVFTAVGKHQIELGVDSSDSMAAMFGGGALLLSPLLLTHSPGWVGQGSGIAIALYLGVVTVGLAYTLFGKALSTLPGPTVVTLTLLEPVTAALLGALVVHEGIRPAGWFGIGMVLVGLVITAGVIGTVVE